MENSSATGPRGAGLGLTSTKLLSGWETAAALRAGALSAPIVMVSADPRQESLRASSAEHHDAYLMKPLDVGLLLETLARLLDIEWTRPEPEAKDASAPARGAAPSPADLDALRELGRIGHGRGILRKLDEIAACAPAAEAALEQLRALARDCDLDAYDAALAEMESL